jgi:CheY-like chemotaxis protein
MLYCVTRETMKQILLIDDERIFHFLSAKIFEVSGIPHEFHSAYDGNEALQKLSEGMQPDFIFVDLDMPNVNGFQFIEKYKLLNVALPGKIIVLTSSISDDERTRVLALGADVYMSKPLSENDIKGLMS